MRKLIDGLRQSSEENKTITNYLFHVNSKIFTLALKLESRRMLEDFRSLWIREGWQCSCRYSNPLISIISVSRQIVTSGKVVLLSFLG